MSRQEYKNNLISSYYGEVLRAFLHSAPGEFKDIGGQRSEMSYCFRERKGEMREKRKQKCQERLKQ